MSGGICADCSASDPTWASISRGVLVCDECCSVHRSLGRHISYIRSLHSTNWPPALREMVSTLVRKGANSIWEHALHDSSTKVKIKKPSPKDKLHPTKHDFIIAKYKHLALLPRVTLKESASMSEDLSKQLHASVRTSNLETCLRLLSLGADPNYLHTDRGNTPLHVAAHAGQAMQVELLFVHGANPTALDRLGHTPEECARIAGHHQLADRLIECQYELTDKLSFFVNGRKPVHSIGEHYLVPPGAGLNVEPNEAKNKLQELSNDLFEELASDVYDEVDRRETDAIWLTTQQLQNSVAFLPVNPMLSSTRNQGRQKLATLDSKEFCELVIDILLDTRKRQNLSLETGQRSGNVVPAVGMALPEHDYDDVPADEEEAAAEKGRKSTNVRSKLTPPIESTYSVLGEDASSSIFEDNYSHLHDRPANQNVGSGVKVDNYSLLCSSDPPAENNAYSVVMDTTSPFDKQSNEFTRKTSKEALPHLKSRPQTTYARLDKRPPMPLPKDDIGGASKEKNNEDVVSRTKFNIIMEQLRKVQQEKEDLQTKNELLNQKVSDLQKQLNKVIEENSGLRRSSTESTTPKTPTSPVSSTAPPTIAPPIVSETLNSPTPLASESQGLHAYAEIGKKKIQKPPVATKLPLKKVVSLPPNVTSASFFPPPSSSSPHSRTTTPSMSPQPPLSTNKSSHQSLSSVESLTPSPGIGGKETPIEDSAFDEDHLREMDPTPPPPPPPRKPSQAQTELNQATPSLVPSKMPLLEDVHRLVKNITQQIAKLLKAAQSHGQNEFVSCSFAINEAVTKLTKCFPKNPQPQEVAVSIRELERSTQHLQRECQTPSQQDLAYHTRLIMNSAYDVAKATRFLVTCMEKSGQV